MFPMALSALRPTARQRRESGAKGRDHSGTFRPRNRALDYVLFPEAIRQHPDLWHAGGAPPKRRHLDRATRPGHPLVRSLSHRIAMPRPRAPAHRGTDPPGVFIHFSLSMHGEGNARRAKGEVSGPFNPQSFLPNPAAPSTGARSRSIHLPPFRAGCCLLRQPIQSWDSFPVVLATNRQSGAHRAEPMKKIATWITQAAIVAWGLAILAFLVIEPQIEGVNANATVVETYLNPFVLFVYGASIPFFVGLRQAFILAGFVRKNRATSPEGLSTLRRFKFCALTLLLLVVASVCFMISADPEDRPAGAFLRLLVAIPTTLVALGATRLERVLQNTPSTKTPTPTTQFERQM